MYNIPDTKENWANPIICKKISNILEVKTAFYWKKINDEAEIVTSLFDDDGYYAKANSLLSETNCAEYIPAFTVAEMQAMLPDYSFARYGKKFRIALLGFYKNERVETERMADALAEMVLIALKNNMVNIKALKLSYS